MKLFKVQFSYAPSSMQSGVFVSESKEQLISSIVCKYSDNDPDFPDYGKYVHVDRKPRSQSDIGYDSGMIEFSVDEIIIDFSGCIHMAYNCC